MTTVRGTIGTAATAASAESRPLPIRYPPEPATPFLLRNGVGLFLAATGFFVVGGLDWWLFPPTGPGSFPLSTLLLLLGFVAAIGGTLAYFFGREDPFIERSTTRRPPATPTPRPAAVLEYGRPRPEVRRVDSSSAPSSGLGAAVVAASAPPPPQPAPPPRTEPWVQTPAPPSPKSVAELVPEEISRNPPGVDDALAELTRIERDMGARRGRVPPSA